MISRASINLISLVRAAAQTETTEDLRALNGKQTMCGASTPDSRFRLHEKEGKLESEH